MKALHIGKYYPPFPGGMENALGDLVTALREYKVQVSVLTHGHKFGEAHDDFVIEVPSFGQWLYAPISPLFPFKLTQLIRQLNPDLLHFHLPNTSAFWALFIPAARRIPWVIHWHADIDVLSNPRLATAYRVYRILEHRMLQQAHTIIATSTDYLASSSTLDPWKHKCVAIPLGRHPNAFPRLNENSMQRAQRLWGNDTIRVLSVARMSYYKGLEHLIQAGSQDKSLKLVIAGPGTEDGLKHLLKPPPAANNVWLAGQQSAEDLHALMASCDCLCLPSIDRSEAFGLVLLEAMYYGKPVIASRIPGSGINWVVEDGVTGRLVPPKSVEHLTQAFKSLRCEPSTWKTMGIQARRRFQDHFNIAISTQKIVELYASVLSDSSH